MADVMKNHESLSKKNLRKTGIIVNGNAIKLFMDAVFLLRRPITPVQTFTAKNMLQCVKWLGWRR
jgi:hypothetical protein